ncbi:hypothetical protein RB595_002028 [Gaeumannomyces hyphopodioides]
MLMKSLLSLGLMGAAATVAAHPHHAPKAGVSRRAVDLNAFRLKATAKYVKADEVGKSPAASVARRADYLEVAKDLAAKVAPGAEYRIVGDHYVGTNGVAHVNLKQQAHGIDIDNADININILNGKVFSYGNNFFTGKVPDENPLKKREFSDPAAALDGAKNVLQLPITGSATAERKEGVETYTLKGTSGAVSDPVARLVYLAQEDGTLALTWRVETDVTSNWLLSYVDAADKNKVHNVVDYVADATYEVYPYGINDPTEGSRIKVTDPWDGPSSPLTWHNDGTSSYNTTRGNNGIAQVNPSGGSAYINNYRPVSPALDFSYPYSPATTSPTSYRDASVAQLFYTANIYHDLLYKLGFTEAAGNFQTSNNGKGGLGNDAVVLNAQDGRATNNAQFGTPPDGQPGRMYMYLWTYSSPQRDCAFEAGVVIHEYTHGLSNRLTGGPANSNCLNPVESGGMGEGWGDFMATAARLKASDTAATDYPMGAWVYNDAKGIRAYPYSTSRTVNPLTYASVNSLSTVHPIGTVWATMLYEVMWQLIAKHGKNTDIFPKFDARGVPTDGKFLTQKLVVDGMALQPCSPNFVQARDAILDADRALTGGENLCAIWTGFARRGLGSGAVYSSRSRTESFTVPSGVC